LIYRLNSGRRNCIRVCCFFESIKEINFLKELRCFEANIFFSFDPADFGTIIPFFFIHLWHGHSSSFNSSIPSSRMVGNVTWTTILFIFLLLLLSIGTTDGRGGRRGGKGKGKTNIQFAQVAEFSLISNQVLDNRVRILKCA
jgi:hypothetical protein